MGNRAIGRFAAAVVAAALVAGVAHGATLGSRFTGFYDLVTARIAELAEGGVLPAEKREHGKLLKVKEQLDLDSPTLETDVLIGLKAMTYLKAAVKDPYSPIYYDSQTALLGVNVRDRLNEWLDVFPEVALYFSVGPDYSYKIPRFNEVAQYWIGSGTLAGDPLTAFKYYKKGLKTLQKRDAYAAKGLAKQRKLDRASRLRMEFYYGTSDSPGTQDFFDSKKGGVVMSMVYDQSDDTATLSITLTRDGIVRHVDFVIPDPQVDLEGFNGPATGLSVTGLTCDVSTGVHSVKLWAWDPATGLAAGSVDFYYLYLNPPESENEENCAGGWGVFTIRDVSVVP